MKIASEVIFEERVYVTSFDSFLQSLPYAGVSGER
jgi:hypothetical protein